LKFDVQLNWLISVQKKSSSFAQIIKNQSVKPTPCTALFTYGFTVLALFKFGFSGMQQYFASGSTIVSLPVNP
jgi:hypothetical protein